MWTQLAGLLVVVVVLFPSAAFGQAGFLSPGDLAQPHAEIVNCFSCHSVDKGVDPQLCMNCHETIRTQVRAGSGFHGRLKQECRDCHADHRGRTNQLIRLDTSTFDHSAEKTGFALNGAHRKAECEDCHTEPGKWTGLQSTCESCHDEPHGKKASKRDLLASCEQCHNETEWKALPIPPQVFDHQSGAQTDYKLEGAHREVFCADCHFDWLFVPVKHENCVDCHQNPHRANFGKDRCENCHANPGSWQVPTFDHTRTGYPLVGQHKDATCESCHHGHATVPIAAENCESCHKDMHSGQFKPRGCEDCHTVDIAAFALRAYDHDSTNFPLVGLHAGVKCEDCHGDREQALYIGRPFEDCDACHVDEHQGRFEPTMCQRCHTPEGFRALFFNHDDTNFPHTGKHTEPACNACHEDFKWIGFPFGSCADCHEEASPHEKGVLGPETCDSCHNTTSFKDISFDHGRETTFDLEPAHTKRKCSDCHTGIDRFTGVSTDCTSCHNDDKPWGHYAGQCGDCHQAALWFPGGLGDNDHVVTGFPLKGAHRLQECEACHTPNRARGEAQPQCASCHTQDDPHRNQLGNVCEDCHAETDWFRVRWRHGTTGWPLRGAHKLAECIDCHATSYLGTPTDCSRCHASQASPDVQAHRFVDIQNCENCHRVFSWNVVFGAGQ